MFGIAAGEGGRDQEAKGIQGQVSFLKPAFPIPELGDGPCGSWRKKQAVQELYSSNAVDCRRIRRCQRSPPMQRDQEGLDAFWSPRSRRPPRAANRPCSEISQAGSAPAPSCRSFPRCSSIGATFYYWQEPALHGNRHSEDAGTFLRGQLNRNRRLPAVGQL